MEPASNKTEEIDLLHYFNLLLDGLRKLKKALLSYVVFLFRNILLLSLIFAVLALLSYLSQYFIPKYFKTDAVFVSHNLSADIYQVMIADLDGLAKSGNNKQSLSEQLNISATEAASIRSVSARSLSKLDFTYKNDTTSISGFGITLVLSDISGLAHIQNGLKNYLEKNEYGSKRREARRKLLELRKENLVVQHSALDSLKEVIRARMLPRSTVKSILVEEPVLPVIQIYKIQQDNLREQTGIEQELEFLENIEIVQPFTKLNGYNTPDVKRILLLSLLASAVLSVVLTTLFGRKNARLQQRPVK